MQKRESLHQHILAVAPYFNGSILAQKKNHFLSQISYKKTN